VTIVVASLALGLAVWALVPSDDWIFLLSMATAYVGLALLATTLLFGPLNVLRGRPTPTNADLRRDVGIWAGIVAVAHVVVGLQVHQRGRMWRYFLVPSTEWPDRLLPLRFDPFGMANWTGLAAGFVLVGLLALSNDLALRRLGGPRWKAFQRWNYAGAGLVVFHGILYQMIENRSLPWVVLLAGTAAITAAIQVAGFRRRRRGRGGPSE
jgi:sulfoxide reductase heme-binding subunit YedZ